MKLGHLRFKDFATILPFVERDDIEQCAVLYGSPLPSGNLWIVGSCIVPNRHEEPNRFFRIVKSDIPADKLAFVVAVGHTHTSRASDGVSAYDVMKMKGTGLAGLVYNVSTHMVRLYDETGWIATTTWRLGQQ